MGDEAGHLKHVGVEHSLLHLVEFISADGVEVVTIELLLQHPRVNVLVQVSSHADVVVGEELGVSFILETVSVGELVNNSIHEVFVI